MQDEEMKRVDKEKLLGLLDGYQGEMTKTLQQLIQIPSVEAEAAPGAPFGPAMAKALEFVLETGKALGLKAKSVDGYAGHLELGEGDDVIGVLVHLDVVPAGNDWTYPAFGGEIHDGKLYGRGTLDDKGPAVAALYGLKAIKESGIKLDKRIRLIFGTDEESGWLDMQYYFEREEKPRQGFSPDAMFPIIHAEKGSTTFQIGAQFAEATGASVVSFQSGERTNIVPDRATAVVAGIAAAEIEAALATFSALPGASINFAAGEQGIVVTAKGVSAHGAMPEEGVNAAVELATFLARLSLPADQLHLLQFMRDHLRGQYNGQGLGIGLKDEVSGLLTANLGIVRWENGTAELAINTRFPISYTGEQVHGGAKQVAEAAGFTYTIVSTGKPHHVAKDSPVVKVLQQVYQEETGQEPTAYAIGGGTYAKLMPEAVAFGPVFPGQPELAHQRDEHISLEDLMRCARIYTLAMVGLANA
jgi:succinyl-diaminopimelate desuccinylase